MSAWTRHGYGGVPDCHLKVFSHLNGRWQPLTNIRTQWIWTSGKLIHLPEKVEKHCSSTQENEINGYKCRIPLSVLHSGLSLKKCMRLKFVKGDAQLIKKPSRC
ncbi:hypothetical protein KIL84_017837 [Mauremys mutica]|uniref:Uncharacterized protein n=1 Tax=Mauremys mutica TaxID=74926 RepID=A0A9D4AXA0_9SAUR|nr:hypothetical protein KIL84_017837 [Mauremys mutica]